MLEPYSKLPWKKCKWFYLKDANEKRLFEITSNPLVKLPDLNYIVESCNNFPKAIELLTKINTHYNTDESERDFEYDIQKEIEQFLNSLNK